MLKSKSLFFNHYFLFTAQFNAAMLDLKFVSVIFKYFVYSLFTDVASLSINVNSVGVSISLLNKNNQQVRNNID